MPKKQGGNISVENGRSANASAANLGFEAKLWLADEQVALAITLPAAKDNRDQAPAPIEPDGSRLKGVLPKDHARTVLDAMTLIMALLTDKIIADRAQSPTLATLRHTLLPKLLSGKLSVAEANENNRFNPLSP